MVGGKLGKPMFVLLQGERMSWDRDGTTDKGHTTGPVFYVLGILVRIA